MSQEKVDRHKQEKANRKKTMRREKVLHVFQRCLVGVVALILVGWVGYSAYNTYEDNREADTAEIDYSALDNLMESIDTLE